MKCQLMPDHEMRYARYRTLLRDSGYIRGPGYEKTMKRKIARMEELFPGIKESVEEKMSDLSAFMIRETIE